MKKLLLFSFILAITLSASGLFSVKETDAEQPLAQRLSQSLSESDSGSGATLNYKVNLPVFTRGYVYPIAALGNCNSKAQCFEYCEDPNNAIVCSLLSVQQGLMSPEQAKQAITFGEMIKGGYLQNCNTMGGCTALCDDQSRQDSCSQLATTLNNTGKVLGIMAPSPTCEVFGCDLAGGGGIGGYGFGNEFPNFGGCQAQSSCGQMLDDFGVIDFSALPRNQSRADAPDLNVPASSNSSSGIPDPAQTDKELSNLQNCIVQSNSALFNRPDTQPLTSDDVIASQQSADQCKRDNPVTAPDTNAIAGDGTDKAVDGVQRISRCLIETTDVENIPACLNLLRKIQQLNNPLNP